MAPPWTSTPGRMETLQARCSAVRVARLFCRRLSERPSPPFISLGIASRERAASLRRPHEKGRLSRGAAAVRLVQDRPGLAVKVGTGRGLTGIGAVTLPANAGGASWRMSPRGPDPTSDVLTSFDDN